MNIILYFCGVKTHVRYEAAAKEQRFLCHILLVKFSRKECGSSNAHKVTHVEYLTAPMRLFVSKNYVL